MIDIPSKTGKSYKEGNYSNEKKKTYQPCACRYYGFGLAACGSNGGDKKSEGNSDSDKVVKVAVVETAYGADMWNDVAAAFEKETGVKVELTIDKNIEDIIQPADEIWRVSGRNHESCWF